MAILWTSGGKKSSNVKVTFVDPQDGSGTDPEIVRDVVANTLVAGDNVTISVDDENNTITISSAGGSTGPIPAVAASAIIRTPSLTPQPGDTLHTLTYLPGNTDTDYQYAGNNSFLKVGEYTYDGLWQADPNDVVLVMLDGDQQDFWPSVYARFTGTGFEPIELQGGTLISLSCGGAGFAQPAIFVGSNYDSPVSWGTYPLAPATFFQPIHTAADHVETRYNYTGNLQNTYNLRQALDAIDALPTPGDPNPEWAHYTRYLNMTIQVPQDYDILGTPSTLPEGMFAYYYPETVDDVTEFTSDSLPGIYAGHCTDGVTPAPPTFLGTPEPGAWFLYRVAVTVTAELTSSYTYGSYLLYVPTINANAANHPVTIPLNEAGETSVQTGNFTGNLAGLEPATVQQALEALDAVVGQQGPPGDPGQDGADALWNFLGEYNAGSSYATGDVVTYGGETWYRLNPHGGNVGDTPSEGTFWTRISAKGNQGEPGLNGDKFATTSSTTLTIDTGTLTLTIGTGLAYTAAQAVLIAYDDSNHMHCAVHSYDPATGVMEVEVDKKTGSGTYSSWTVNLDGAVGQQGPPGDPGSDGLDGLSAYEVAVAAGFTGNVTQWLDSLVGADGTDGSDGTNGLDGKTVRSGSGAPSSGLGVDGDFYIDTSANTIYGPKTSGSWGSSTSLVGPKGDTGPTGVVAATSPLTYNAGTQTVAIDQTSITITESQVTNLTNDLAGKVPTSRTVTAGTGLTGGGDLSADRTLSVSYGTTSGTAAEGNDSRITGAVQSSLVDAKGDLLVGTADNTVARLVAGTNGHVLTADSTQTAGVKWAAASAGASFTGFYGSNLFYSLMPLELASSGTFGGGVTPVKDMLVATRAVVFDTVSITGLKTYIRTAGAAGAKLGVALYASSGGKPTGNPVVSTEIDVSTNLWKNPTWTGVSVSAGAYWIVWWTNDTTVRFQMLSTGALEGSQWLLGSDQDNLGQSYTLNSGTVTYSATMPDVTSTTFTPSIVANPYPLWLKWKVA